MLTLFDDLLNDFSLPPGSFLTYAALTRVAASYWGSLPNEPATSVLLQTILTHGNTNKAVTNLHNALHIDDAAFLTTLRTYWGEALAAHSLTTSGNRLWQQALAAPKIISMNARYKLIQFNYLHHTYLAPARPARIYTSARDEYPRCHSESADFLHMVWSCP
ncbi:hypothetical protein NDU88_001688 [Pleurodeles waltl]|uniref:Uncharacterized protein n=1 Tax=Pleurodeles waltl TaxID=8319 RepID=A0AAV7PD92_PLEWA|nr:hypothetical protein NDU88_001688 [Pleurodeles waltl]